MPKQENTQEKDTKNSCIYINRKNKTKPVRWVRQCVCLCVWKRKKNFNVRVGFSLPFPQSEEFHFQYSILVKSMRRKWIALDEEDDGDKSQTEPWKSENCNWKLPK